MAERIYLVDDDQSILMTLEIFLKSEGYAVKAFSSAQAALREITAAPPDLCVFDIKMPEIDGMRLLQKVRETHALLPIVFLTSKDGVQDEIEGLSLGADDYIKKPFSLPLLLGRLKAVLRRYQRLEQGDEQKKIIKRGEMILDDDRYQIRWRGLLVDLTVTEYLLVKALAEHVGHVKTRDQLMDAASGEDSFSDDRAVDSHIKRIRKKFKDLDPSFEAIETIYGAGYALKL
jgi:two-component system response regulator ChvI